MRNHSTYNEDHHYHNVDHHHDHYRKPVGPWFYLAVAALIIIPLTVFGFIQHDNFTHAMERQGCHVVNVLEEGNRVWSCPKDVK